jgi:hypothetical protein
LSLFQRPTGQREQPTSIIHKKSTGLPAGNQSHVGIMVKRIF